jgi:hypothetical protein
MKKLLSFPVAAMLACLFISPSCRKTEHATNPTPSNVRLLGYTEIITQTIVAPIRLTPVITETYSFAYNSDNRLSLVLFATNDSNQKRLGLLDLRAVYTYTGGSISRAVTNLKSTSIVETDIFNQNAFGQLTSAYFPWDSHLYTYQGKLLASQKDIYADTGTTITAYTTFTSDNHDLLNQFFNGTLTANFSDTGLRPVLPVGATVRDSVMTLPITVTWTTYSPTGGTPAVTTHQISSFTSSGQLTDNLTGYSQQMVRLDAVDPYGIYTRPVYFPAGLNPRRYFQYYNLLDNRMGDYLQLESFKIYGMNLYDNQHLIKQISTDYDTTFISYDIDGQSKITQTHVLKKDKLGNRVQMEYKLQYDTR